MSRLFQRNCPASPLFDSPRRLELPAESGLAFSIRKRIEDFDPWPLKVLHVSCSDRQIVAARDRCNVAVFNRHWIARFLWLVLLVRPHVNDRHVESENPAVHRLDQFCQPLL